MEQMFNGFTVFFRNVLKKHSYTDILPPDENCVLVIMERSSITSGCDLLRWVLRRHVDGSRGPAAPEPEWHQLREAPSTSSLSLNAALLRAGPS